MPGCPLHNYQDRRGKREPLLSVYLYTGAVSTPPGIPTEIHAGTSAVTKFYDTVIVGIHLHIGIVILDRTGIDAIPP